MGTKNFSVRRLARIFKLDSAPAASPASSPASSPCRSAFLGCLHYSRPRLDPVDKAHRFRFLVFSRSFCSRLFDLVDGHSQGPATINYHSLLQEDEFHRIADSTIHGLQEKLEEYGDNVQIDGFDVDYGNDVLTVKLGDHGTYVLNKQTPNRQLWLSSLPINAVTGLFMWSFESRLGSARAMLDLQTKQNKLGADFGYGVRATMW